MKVTAMTDAGRPMLYAAPHRALFFTGLLSLLTASAWWGLHLLARATGAPLFALVLQPAPLWAHAWLMLFAVLPAVFFGFLFTVFPRWMNGPTVGASTYLPTAALFAAGTLLWLIGTFAGTPFLLLGCAATGTGLLVGTFGLFRVLLASSQVVSHAVVVLIALCVQSVALAGFAWGIAAGDDFALHFAVRTSLWGGLLPIFFAVSHRMIPFFSQSALPGYVPWRPLWILVAVVGLVYLRLLLGTAGLLSVLQLVDIALVVLTSICAARWTTPRARGNALLWTLYAGFAWLPVALLLQAVRDGGFALTGEWWLGRAPTHALGMGFCGGLLVAMVTRVTMGHSGRPLRMDGITMACFLVLQLGAASRVLSEVLTAPAAVQALLLLSVGLWIGAIGVWVGRVAGIYLRPRSDGKPG
jgi:uncharacterized protein involved in response to NO